jgi:hypothetical protein
MEQCVDFGVLEEGRSRQLPAHTLFPTFLPDFAFAFEPKIKFTQNLFIFLKYQALHILTGKLGLAILFTLSQSNIQRLVSDDLV